MKYIEKIIGQDYYLVPTEWTVAGASRDNVYFNTYYSDVPDLLALQRPLTVELCNGERLNFPVV